jgi:hypothetical protein
VKSYVWSPFVYSHGAVHPRAAAGGGEHGRPLVVDGEAVPGRRSLCPRRVVGPAPGVLFLAQV